jgi:hypothetical protein
MMSILYVFLSVVLYPAFIKHIMALLLDLPNFILLPYDYYTYDHITLVIGRAVAQAVSRWLPSAAARVRVRAACGVCCGQSGTGAGFLRVLRFPLTIIPPISPSS